MAQTWRGRSERKRKDRPPLDAEGLERLALSYVGRYATTRAKLEAYLARKVKERGWEDAVAPPLARIVERFAELGYVNDGAFAASRAASLARRGYGERRVADALRAAGIDGEEAQAALAGARDEAWTAVLRFAERKRLGPYAAAPADPDARRRAAAAMLRAGHPLDLVRRVLDAPPGEVPEPLVR